MSRAGNRTPWAPGRGLPPRRGVAMVELAVVLPLLLLLLLGAIDFGRFAHSYITVTNASRSGAAFGAVNPFTTATQGNWQTQVRDRVTQEMQGVMDADAEFGDADLAVTAVRSLDAGGLWRIRVEVTYPFEPLVPWPGIPARLDMKRAVEMRGIR